MNSQTYEQENTIEIDLVALLKKLLLQWKAIIIFSLIIGLIASGLKYAKDSSACQASLALSQANTSGDAVLKNSGLTDDEKDAVEQAVAQKKQIDSQSDYLTDSLYMNLDPMNLKQLSILYFVRAEKGANAADLLAIYKEHLLSDDSVDQIQKAMDLDTSPKYIRELISVYDADSSDSTATSTDSSSKVMKVTFYLPKKIDSATIDKTIEKIITDYDLSEIGNIGGSVHKISSAVNTVTNTDMQQSQTTLTTNLNSLKSTYKTTTDAFSDDQKNLLNSLLSENDPDEQDKSTEVQESAATTASTVTAPSFSVKYFAIGFVLGILIYIFGMVIIEIVRSKCSSIAAYNSGMTLGAILDIDHHKKNFLFADGLLMKALYKKQSDLDAINERILTKAQMNSASEKLSGIELWTVGFDASSNPAIDKLISAAHQKAITITLKSTPVGRPDDMLPAITPGKSVLLAIQDSTSRKKDASFLTEMLYTRKADYLGMIELM